MAPPVNLHLDPQTGTAFELRCGRQLRIIDPLGEQVADLIAFADGSGREWMSSGRTIDYNSTISLTAGHVLFSSASNPMFTILEDTVGKHDFLLTPCSPDTFRILYNHHGHHPSCLENLAQGLARFGIEEHQIPTTFNAFMNVAVMPSGQIEVLTPLSRPGDYILLRAEMDLLVGVSACSAEKSNNSVLKPIDLEIFG